MLSLDGDNFYTIDVIISGIIKNQTFVFEDFKIIQFISRKSI